VESQFGHGDVEAVPRAHPQFFLVRLRSVTRALQRLPRYESILVFVVPAVDLRLPLAFLGLVSPRRAPGRLLVERVRSGRSAAGRPERRSGSPGVERARRFPVVRVGERGSGRPRALEGAQRHSFLQRGGHFVQIFKVLGQP